MPGLDSLIENKIKDIFQNTVKDETGNIIQPPACFVIYLKYDRDESGNIIQLPIKNFLGKVTSYEHSCNVQIEPYNENVVELNQKLFDNNTELYKALETMKAEKEAAVSTSEKYLKLYRKYKADYEALL